MRNYTGKTEVFKIKIHTLIFLSILLVSHLAKAETDSQWIGGGSDDLWTTSGNWNNGIPPGVSPQTLLDTASFSGDASQTTSTISGPDVLLGVLSFDNATVSYIINIGYLDFYGAGITNNSGKQQYINNINDC